MSEIQKIWNDICGAAGLPRFDLTEKRRRAMKQRWPAEMKRDLDRWRKFCETVSVSSFHRGENERQWRANIEWALRPDVIVKMFESQQERSVNWWEMPEYVEVKHANAH